MIYLPVFSDRFLPRSSRERYKVLQWLMFRMRHAGPMLGQTHHFRLTRPKVLFSLSTEGVSGETNLEAVVGSEGGLLGYFSRVDSLMQPGHNLEGSRCTT